MGRLKSPAEIEIMRLAGRVVAEALAQCSGYRPGKTTTLDLDQVAAEVLRKRGAKSAFLGYQPSFSDVLQALYVPLVNSEVVHGVPSKRRVLREGDIISLDMGASIDGWYADSPLPSLSVKCLPRRGTC